MEWTDLPGGGAVRLIDDCPVAMRIDPARRYELDGTTLLERAEGALGVWLVWESRWRLDEDAGGVANETRPMQRAVRLADAQPTHRVRFDADGGGVLAWALRVEPSPRDADVAWAWTHAEWNARGHRYADGGDWRRINGVWVLRGCSTPNGASGVLTVEEITR